MCEKKELELDFDMKIEGVELDFDMKIEGVENGYIVRTNDSEHNPGNIKTLVFEEHEFGECDELNKDIPFELVPMYNMLNYIKEYFGVFHSKHNIFNLVVKIEKNN